MSTKNKIIVGLFIVLAILNTTDFIKSDKVNITFLSGVALVLLIVAVNLILILRVKLKLYTVGSVRSSFLVDDNKNKPWLNGKSVSTEIEFATIDNAINIAKINSIWKQVPQIGQKVKLVLNRKDYNKSEILDDSHLPIATTLILVGVLVYLIYLGFKN